MRKKHIILLSFLSICSLSVLGQVTTPQEVLIHKQQQQMFWQQNYGHVTRNLLSSDPEIQFKASEDIFLLRPISGEHSPLGYSQLLMIRSEYQKDIAKLSKNATTDQKKKILSKHFENFNKKEEESKFNMGVEPFQGSMNYQYGNPYLNLNPSVYGLQPGINLNCNPYNNYQFCTSDQGVEYKRIDGGDIGSRIEGKVLDQEAVKEELENRAAGSVRE